MDARIALPYHATSSASTSSVPAGRRGRREKGHPNSRVQSERCLSLLLLHPSLHCLYSTISLFVLSLQSSPPSPLCSASSLIALPAMPPIRPSSLQSRTIYSARSHPVYPAAAVPPSSSLARLLCSPSPPPTAIPLPPPAMTPFYADTFYSQASAASSPVGQKDDGMLWTDSLDARSDTSNDASGDEEMVQTQAKDSTAMRLDSPFVESTSSKKKQPRRKKGTCSLP